MTLEQIKALAKTAYVRKRTDGRFELCHKGTTSPKLYESFGSEKAARLKYELVLMQNIS